VTYLLFYVGLPVSTGTTQIFACRRCMYKASSGGSSIHIHHLKRDLELVKRKVAKKIGLLCRALRSTAALRLRRPSVMRREVMSLTLLKPLHIVAVSTWSCRGRRLARAGSLFARALSESFPSRCQPNSPSFLMGLPGLENLTKTLHTDITDRNATVKPACPNTKKRVEWLNMSGLERPRKTFSLARDDLEAALAF